MRPGGRGRGHRQPQDRRLPGGLPLLLAVRAVRLAGAQRVAGHPEPGRGRQADRQDRRDRVLHRRRGARARRAADGAGRRRHRGDPQRGRHPDRLLAGHADPGRRSTELAAMGVHRYNHNLETARSYFPQRGHHPHLGGALGDAADGPRRGHGGVLRRHPRDGRDAGAAGRVRRPAGRARSATRCR